jgi:hypothetical protein
MNGTIVFQNKEKKSAESWTPGRNIANLPHPFRAVFIARPSAGKTNCILNMLLHCNFDRVYLAHPQTLKEESDTEDDSENESEDEEPKRVIEYRHLDYIPITSIDELKAKTFDPLKKNLVIIDDIMLRGLPKYQQNLVTKMFSYVSTHRNVSVMCSSQNPSSQLQVSILRFCNFFAIWNYPDRYFLLHMLSKLGFEGNQAKKLINIFQTLGPFEHIDFDRTVGTPYPVRKNICEKIEIDFD